MKILGWMSRPRGRSAEGCDIRGRWQRVRLWGPVHKYGAALMAGSGRCRYR